MIVEYLRKHSDLRAVSEKDYIFATGPRLTYRGQGHEVY